jgi:hypothetical protein
MSESSAAHLSQIVRCRDRYVISGRLAGLLDEHGQRGAAIEDSAILVTPLVGCAPASMSWGSGSWSLSTRTLE